KRIKSGKVFKNGTDIDKVYELLQEVRHIRIGNCAKLFEVKPAVVEDWAKTLESSDLAELAYPRIGGPELRLISLDVGKEDSSKKVKQKKQGFFNKENIVKR
ncbi:MAG: hypothetical protein KC506_01360, partial [Nanoarchaeota archaeon]|nr:hypothetical protein [Nanoarchaeota archaeon]